MRELFSKFLDRQFPRRICLRNGGHDWGGAEFMGPHSDEGGGIFYALRHRVFCKCCKKFLEQIPMKEWPRD